MSPRPRSETSRYESTGHPGIERDKRSGIFYLRDTIATDELKGVHVDRSLKTIKISEAIDRAKRIRVKLAQGDSPLGVRHSFDEGFDLVLKIQSTKALKTLEQAETQIDGHLRPWFRAYCPSIDQFVTSYESVWADYKLAQGVKTPGRKLEHDRRYLLMALKRAYRAGWIKREFMKKDLELNEVSEPIGEYIPEKELRAMLKASKPYRKLYCQILIASHMGMRISEILHLRVDEVDLKRREIDLDAGRVKTRRRRQVPIPIMDEVYPHLKAFVLEAPGPFVFPAERHNLATREVEVDPNRPQDDNRFHWDKVRKAVGSVARFHDLRHTAITNLLIAGIPGFAVEKICGVEEETMKRIYAHVAPEIQNQVRGAFCGKFVEFTRQSKTSNRK